MLYKTWYHGVSHKEQLLYQPVLYFTYWPVLDSLNNRNIIKFSNIGTSSEDFNNIQNIFLDGISGNMDSI